MRTGILELPSGRWRWTVHPRHGRVSGASVHFENLSRWGEEMRTWAFSEGPTEEEIRELAREPVVRTWIDTLGNRWEVTTELSSGRSAGAAPAAGGGPRPVWLTFKKAMVKRVVPVADGFRLGEAEPGELGRLLESAA